LKVGVHSHFPFFDEGQTAGFAFFSNKVHSGEDLSPFRHVA